MTLITRTGESIKIALAMTIAYGIALSMERDRPYWTRSAVAVVSLLTTGPSLNCGTQLLAPGFARHQGYSVFSLRDLTGSRHEKEKVECLWLCWRSNTQQKTDIQFQQTQPELV